MKNNEDLEEKISKEKIEPDVWDSLVSAYSSGKAVLVTFLTANQGYPIMIAAATSIYFSFKTLGAAAKYILSTLIKPREYLNSQKLISESWETVKNYNPFGKLRVPTGLGATISVVTYLTGF